VQQHANGLHRVRQVHQQALLIGGKQSQKQLAGRGQIAHLHRPRGHGGIKRRANVGVGQVVLCGPLRRFGRSQAGLVGLTGGLGAGQACLACAQVALFDLQLLQRHPLDVMQLLGSRGAVARGLCGRPGGSQVGTQRGLLQLGAGQLCVGAHQLRLGFSAVKAQQ
jgi:hypothetical protein